MTFGGFAKKLCKVAAKHHEALAKHHTDLVEHHAALAEETDGSASELHVKCSKSHGLIAKAHLAHAEALGELGDGAEELTSDRSQGEKIFRSLDDGRAGATADLDPEVEDMVKAS